MFDRPASPPPAGVDPTEMTLSDRRKLFEKGQAPKVGLVTNVGQTELVQSQC